MKRFLSLLIVLTLLISLLGIVTAYADASISGDSNVQAGHSYTYKGSASYTAGDLIGKIEGLGQVNSFGAMAGGLTNESLSGSTSISVTIPSDAQPGTKYTISFSGSYSVMADDGSGASTPHNFSSSKTITVVTAPTSTKKPSTTTNAKPKATPEPTEWELAADGVASMAEGDTITLEITEDTELPIEILSDVRDKQGVLKINFGSYTCTIDTKSDFMIIPEDMTSLDLGLSMEKDEEFSGSVNGADVYQLHFDHEGQFPCKVSYTFKAEQSQPGDTVYLYYYYTQSGIIEGKMSSVVDADGYVTFKIYHCSSYFVADTIIDGAEGNFSTELEEAKQALQQEQEKNSALETELTAAKQALEEMEAAQSDDDTLGASAAAAVPSGDTLDLSIVALISALAASAMLAILLTMLVFRVGMFKRKQIQSAVAADIAEDSIIEESVADMNEDIDDNDNF